MAKDNAPTEPIDRPFQGRRVVWSDVANEVVQLRTALLVCSMEAETNVNSS